MAVKTAIERRVRIGDWLVPYDDATKEIKLNRTLADILAARPGDALDCMNTVCIRAQRNEHVFPHPVLVVSTIRSRVYIVDALTKDGTMPAHAIRYELSRRDSRLIAEHDRSGTGEPGELTLHIPKDPKGSPKRAKYSGRFTDTTEGSERYSGDGTRKHRNRRPITSIGAAARYKVAVGALKIDPP